MKKFYSLVLMAAALLIGTNAWANYPANWLQVQFDAVQAGGQVPTIITMEDDIILTDPVYLGTATVDEDRKSIILDMNGHSITMDATTWKTSHPGVFCSMFTITHGELLVRNNASDKATNPSLIQMTGTGEGNYNNIFNVAGSYKSSRWVKSGNAYAINESAAINTRDKGWFTHLEIGEGVKLVAENTIAGAGISMDGYYGNYHALVSPDAALTYVFGGSATDPKSAGALTASKGNVCLYSRADAPAYNTAIMCPNANGNGEGFAYGLRVDVYGDIEFATAATSGKSYGIKLNGGLKSSLTSSDKFLNRNCWYMDSVYAKTYADAKKPTSSANKTYSVSGDYYTNHIPDTIDAPFLYVHSSAHITAASNLNEATAVYCSGYGKTLIEGECKGNSGVNIKSGTVELHDAVITGTATNYSNAQAGNHATGSGGIIVNSVENRAGGIEVVISGDTKVSTTVGYAIEETVNKEDGSDVSSIAIQGGTIEGGSLGAIALTTDGEAATAVTGGNINGTASVDGTTVDVSNLVPNTSQYHTTEVTVNGKTVIVVSEGAGPVDANKGNWETISAKTGQNVVWNAVEEASIAEDQTVTLGELQITAGSENNLQELTIAKNATLKVNHLIMNDYARIIVEAGGKLIVEGTQGIVAPKVDNIILKASESAQALFLFNPAVTSNRHPNATVQVYTNCYQLTQSPAKTYVRQRLAIPVMETGKPANNFSGKVFPGSGASFLTYAWTWDGYKWAAITGWNQLKPFIGYTFSNNSQAAGVTYSFAGELVGNGDAEYNFPTGGFDYFGCSHVAPIYLDSLFKHFASDMEAAVWIYDFGAHQYKTITAEDLEEFPEVEEIKPMEAFVLNLHGASGKSGMNYASAIWGNPNMDAVIGRPSQKNPAPARSRFNDASNRAIVNIIAENGYRDQVKLIEKDQYTAEFENGADANKLMFADGINLYATTEAGELARVATDDLKGTLLSFRAGNSAEYTITLTSVLGEDYALRDNVTGQIITFAEGATYTFMQEANTTVPARFEVIAIAKVATAIENVEEAAKATGIYTITGQYVGRDFTNLPAGAYIVNGVKVIK